MKYRPGLLLSIRLYLTVESYCPLMVTSGWVDKQEPEIAKCLIHAVSSPEGET
jgi:hypothetical protein